jgi:hypothetical protein
VFAARGAFAVVHMAATHKGSRDDAGVGRVRALRLASLSTREQ